jgi:Relaxase/Mobilisation nuclease domain
MICKISQGAGFGGVVNYVMGKDKAELLGSKDVRSFDSRLVIQDFEMVSKQNLRVKKNMVHISVSFHEKDKPNINNEKMKEIASKIIDGMGFSNAQYIVVKHNDADHPHFHIVTSRVMDLKTISDKFIRLRLNKLRIEIEKLYPELTTAGINTIDEASNKNLKGKDATKYKIYNAIKIELQNSRSIEMLLKNLEQKHGIKYEFKYKSGTIDNIEGVKFNLDNVWLSGSKIHKSCSYLNLIKRLNENKVETNVGLPKVNTTNKSIISGLAKNILAIKAESGNGAKKIKKKKEDELER